MKKLDRVLVIAALCASVIAIVRQPAASRPAIADGPREEKLGPADQLVLRDADSELVLVAREGRLAWGDGERTRAWSIGAMHSDRAMQGLLRSETFLEERETLDMELQEQGEEFRIRFEEAQERFGDVQPGDDEFAEAQQVVGGIMQEYQAFEAQVTQIRSKLHAEQLERAYRQMLAAVEVVAERRDIDIVTRFIPASIPFEAVNVEQAMLQIQLRSLLAAPDAIDLTEDVLKELALDA